METKVGALRPYLEVKQSQYLLRSLEKKWKIIFKIIVINDIYKARNSPRQQMRQVS